MLDPDICACQSQGIVVVDPRRLGRPRLGRRPQGRHCAEPISDAPRARSIALNSVASLEWPGRRDVCDVYGKRGSPYASDRGGHHLRPTPNSTWVVAQLTVTW